MIRRLVFILLALNSLLFLWERYGRPPRNAESMMRRDPALAPLLLLREDQDGMSTPATVASEASTATLPTEAAASPVAASPTMVYACVGPFPDRQAASRFATQLHRLAIEVEMDTMQAEVVTGYWLMYPVQADMAAARQNLQTLRAMGLTDLWLFEEGPYRGAISLGLYTQHERARAVAARLRARSLEVEIRPRRRVQTMFRVCMKREPFPGWLQNLPATLSVSPYLQEVSRTATVGGVSVSPRL